MIDNLKLLLPLLEFNSSDDYYYLQILQRKKENPHIGSNSRVIANYYISSQQHLLDRYDEIKTLCEVFNARASLRLNIRSFEKTAFKTLQNIANSMANHEYEFIKNSYTRAAGAGHNDKRKKWILDIDNCSNADSLELIIKRINAIEPVGHKIYEIVPSKTGYHLITEPFNLQTFSNAHPEIEVHKDNPTNLYIP